MTTTVTLTTDEQSEIVAASDQVRASVFDEHMGDLFVAVERIIAARFQAVADKWDAKGLYIVQWHANGKTCTQEPAFSALLDAAGEAS